MKTESAMKYFEQAALWARGDRPPEVRVAHQVLAHVRGLQRETERTLAVMALGSCTIAVGVTLLGFWLFMNTTEPLDLLFEIVPPIGL